MSSGMVIGNWKMNLDYVEAVHLTQQLVTLMRAHPSPATQVVVAPPFVDLRSVTSVLEAERSPIEVAAQHVNPHERGAHTGEVSLGMLARLGVTSVIVGHSERRTMYHMDDDVVRATVAAVISRGLRPIVCVGEDVSVRDQGDPDEHVRNQIAAALEGIEGGDDMVVAYEPLWAIGTGRSADAAQVRAMTTVIHAALRATGRAGARVLYGGSVTPENASGLIEEGGVDGFLVGGASLSAESFHAIIRVVNDCYAGRR